MFKISDQCAVKPSRDRCLLCRRTRSDLLRQLLDFHVEFAEHLFHHREDFLRSFLVASRIERGLRVVLGEELDRLGVLRPSEFLDKA